jgi:hypothetical protein
MHTNVLKVVIVLIIAGLLAALGYLVVTFNGPTASQTAFVDPTGFLVFSALETGTNRNYPHAYDIESKEFVAIPNDQNTYYIQTLPGESYSYIQASFAERAPEDMQIPYDGNSELVTEDAVIELDNVVNPGELSWSPAAEKYIFHALSREYTNATEPNVYFSTENFQDSSNWGVYVVDPISEQVTEIVAGHSPVWSADGKYIYYLSVSGLNSYEVSSGLVSPIATLTERIPTPSSSMALSEDGNSLFILITAYTVSQARLFEYDVSVLGESNRTDIDLPLLRQIDLLERDYFDLTLSPDTNFAAVTTYGNEKFEVHTLNLQSNSLDQEMVFSWSGIDKYFHFPQVSWVDLSPVVTSESGESSI